MYERRNMTRRGTEPTYLVFVEGPTSPTYYVSWLSFNLRQLPINSKRNSVVAMASNPGGGWRTAIDCQLANSSRLLEWCVGDQEEKLKVASWFFCRGCHEGLVGNGDKWWWGVAGNRLGRQRGVYFSQWMEKMVGVASTDVCKRQQRWWFNDEWCVYKL